MVVDSYELEIYTHLLYVYTIILSKFFIKNQEYEPKWQSVLTEYHQCEKNLHLKLNVYYDS